MAMPLMSEYAREPIRHPPTDGQDAWEKSAITARGFSKRNKELSSGVWVKTGSAGLQMGLSQCWWVRQEAAEL
ncbi:hypothetical protein N7489_001373 [Penicillium chrysogenum]|uniref:Uncharacterized protein n=1 Tax=Penicillium chrysogenum TaxID=5076 RepID=A0ABQ8WIU8_PENCH|nr:uncharacterized protein N7489_001373 [Penicillium chrysogenum]KAJ5250963.1 hypothetical protein N7489_001373 [Penicillium chrysogenum]KAJ5262401.1 hypothetical protein N7524_007706 [Penicillium chrysogenum]KAJ5269863.1 hypothetical protein N7505_005621 [Penicillium chrysogenum]